MGHPALPGSAKRRPGRISLSFRKDLVAHSDEHLYGNRDVAFHRGPEAVLLHTGNRVFVQAISDAVYHVDLLRNTILVDDEADPYLSRNLLPSGFF